MQPSLIFVATFLMLPDQCSRGPVSVPTRSSSRCEIPFAKVWLDSLTRAPTLPPAKYSRIYPPTCGPVAARRRVRVSSAQFCVQGAA